MTHNIKQIALQLSAQGGKMTKDQIDELMRENGIVVVGEAVYILCNLVEEQSAAAEREACANVCDSYDVAEDVCSSDTAEGIAIAIRARGQNE